MYYQKWDLYLEKYLFQIGVLDMDCECVNSFLVALLAATYGSQTRCSMGKR